MNTNKIQRSNELNISMPPQKEEQKEMYTHTPRAQRSDELNNSLAPPKKEKGMNIRKT